MKYVIFPDQIKTALIKPIYKKAIQNYDIFTTNKGDEYFGKPDVGEFEILFLRWTKNPRIFLIQDFFYWSAVWSKFCSLVEILQFGHIISNFILLSYFSQLYLWLTNDQLRVYLRRWYSSSDPKHIDFQRSKCDLSVDLEKLMSSLQPDD